MRRLYRHCALPCHECQRTPRTTARTSRSACLAPGYWRRRQNGWLIARAGRHGACSVLVDMATMNWRSVQHGESGTSGAVRDPILGPAWRLPADSARATADDPVATADALTAQFCFLSPRRPTARVPVWGSVTETAANDWPPPVGDAQAGRPCPEHGRKSHQELHHRPSGERARNFGAGGGGEHRHGPGIERRPAHMSSPQGGHVHRMTLDGRRTVNTGEFDGGFK